MERPVEDSVTSGSALGGPRLAAHLSRAPCGSLSTPAHHVANGPCLSSTAMPNTNAHHLFSSRKHLFPLIVPHPSGSLAHRCSHSSPRPVWRVPASSRNGRRQTHDYNHEKCQEGHCGDLSTRPCAGKSHQGRSDICADLSQRSKGLPGLEACKGCPVEQIQI